MTVTGNIIDLIEQRIRDDRVSGPVIWNEIEGRLIEHTKGFGPFEVKAEWRRIASELRNRILIDTELSKFIFDKLDN